MRKLLNIIITLLFGFIYFYIALPAINMQSISFWFFISILIIFYYVVSKIKFKNITLIRRNYKLDLKSNLILLVPFGIFLLILLVNIVCSPVFMSGKYASRIKVNKDTEFTKDIEEVDFTRLPLLDKASSQKLGDRVMGQMSDLVSQYNVSDLYTQINYNNKILRVTPLEYASFIKWLTNRKDGVKGYITVDSVSGESKLTRLSNGMKYLPSAYFNENLYRKLRFSYPTLNFGNISFEIDNEGNPYWVVTVLKYTGVETLASVDGVVILNAITGESQKYDVGSIPTWIDMAYSASLIIEQVDDWGTYQDGFINSIFGQKNVVNTTEGYNYLAYNDDIYLYTGVTSIVNDESNLGFILTNMRTGETNFYNVAGAEEYSAMASAEGAVQQMKYKSTFPLLINLNNRPTYLVSLKDAAGLVKMYGFVDVVDYQKVVVTDASKGIKEAAKNYLNNITTEIEDSTLKTKTITIKSIAQAIIDGTSYYYIVDTDNQKYKASIELSDTLPFIKSYDKLNISYVVEEDIIIVQKID